MDVPERSELPMLNAKVTAGGTLTEDLFNRVFERLKADGWKIEPPPCECKTCGGPGR